MYVDLENPVLVDTLCVCRNPMGGLLAVVPGLETMLSVHFGNLSLGSLASSVTLLC